MPHWSVIVLQSAVCDGQEKGGTRFPLKNQIQIDLVIQRPYKYGFESQTTPAGVYIC